MDVQKGGTDQRVKVVKPGPVQCTFWDHTERREHTGENLLTGLGRGPRATKRKKKENEDELIGATSVKSCKKKKNMEQSPITKNTPKKRTKNSSEEQHPTKRK